MAQAKALTAAACILTLLAAPPAEAGKANGCDAALVSDVYSSSERIREDYRLSILVDESMWSQRRREASGSATLYGVPMGASYSEYRQNARSRLERRDESRHYEEARNVAWTGLSGISAQAYRDCLNRLAVGNRVILQVEHATEQEVTLQVRWSRDDFGPTPVQLQWDAPPEITVRLPPILGATSNLIGYSVPRPTEGQRNIVVRALHNGLPIDSDNLVLIAPQRIPPPEIQARCEVVLYEHIGFGGRSVRYEQDVRQMEMNDAASSARVLAGIWRFYRDMGFSTPMGDYGPGDYERIPNDMLTSVQCIRPTPPRR